MTRPHTDSRPVLYLDIDGVLLVRRSSAMFDGFNLAPHCFEFLEFATSRFDCRWLSSRCRHGFLDGSRRAFRAAGAPLNDPRWAVLDLIKPAAWTASKIEAINPESNFWWAEDSPTEAERHWLRIHGREDRLVEVWADSDPGALMHVQSRLTAVFT